MGRDSIIDQELLWDLFDERPDRVAELFNITRSEAQRVLKHIKRGCRWKTS